jgi:hypothetical protein
MARGTLSKPGRRDRLSFSLPRAWTHTQTAGLFGLGAMNSLLADHFIRGGPWSLQAGGRRFDPGWLH